MRDSGDMASACWFRAFDSSSRHELDRTAAVKVCLCTEISKGMGRG